MMKKKKKERKKERKKDGQEICRRMTANTSILE
jgi:hypothetical protein